MDLLSEVLLQVRLAGAFLFRAGATVPCCIAVSPLDAAHEFARGSAPLISFHAMLTGHAWVRSADGRTLRLDPGDVVVLPHGDAHLIGEALDSLPVPKAQFFANRPISAARDLQWGEGEASHRFLCGFLDCEREAFAPLFAALPRMFKVSLRDDAGARASSPLVDYAERETLSQRPGADGSRLRVAELMFVEALRRHVETLPDLQQGWLAGLRDPVVGRAMALLHADPARRWTVDALAGACASSRSSLASRFARTIGEPPMQYLQRWRMLLAARRLRDGDASIVRIAESVGYDSQPAFQRCFKRHLGATPAAWRRRVAADAGAAAET